jgi:O-antigen/teichoic acid export membrane protein
LHGEEHLETVKAFVGKDYYAGLDVVPILLLANLFLGVFYNLSIWYKLTNRTIFGAYISLIGAAVTLLTNVLLIPVFGYMGAAWSHFICYAAIMILSYVYGQKYYPVPYNLRKIGLYFGAALVIYGANEWIKTLVPGFYLLRASLLMMLFIALVLLEFRSYLPLKKKIIR